MKNALLKELTLLESQGLNYKNHRFYSRKWSRTHPTSGSLQLAKMLTWIIWSVHLIFGIGWTYQVNRSHQTLVPEQGLPSSGWSPLKFEWHLAQSTIISNSCWALKTRLKVQFLAVGLFQLVLLFCLKGGTFHLGNYRHKFLILSIAQMKSPHDWELDSLGKSQIPRLFQNPKHSIFRILFRKLTREVKLWSRQVK